MCICMPCQARLAPCYQENAVLIKPRGSTFQLFGDGVHNVGCWNTLGWMVRVERI